MALRILVDVPAEPRVSVGLVRAAVEAALRDSSTDEAEISVALLRDDAIRALNRSWLDHDWVPDVLSFALHEEGETPVGDIYIGLDQAVRQAEEHGVPLNEELARLAVHGTLHVLGRDHPEAEQDRGASAFFERQEALVSDLMRTYGAGRRTREAE